MKQRRMPVKRLRGRRRHPVWISGGTPSHITIKTEPDLPG
jgi:hypothetical protein